MARPARALLALLLSAAVVLPAPVPALAAGGTISGTLTGDGAPLAGVVVAAEAKAVAGTDVATAVTAADGTFTLAVPAGSYVVRLAPPDPWLGGWYHWLQGTVARAYADTVTVAEGAAVTGIDAGLARGWTVYGMVAGASGASAAGATVTLCDAWDTATCPATGAVAADGSFALEHVRAGSWLLRVTGAPAALRDGWYAAGADGHWAATDWDATSLVVEADTAVAMTLPLRVAIKGAVRSTGGVAIAGATVTACAGDACTSTTTGADGTFTTPHLAPGAYTIEVGALDPWFGGFYSAVTATHTVASAASASPVTVGAASVTLPAMGLARGYALTGRVADIGGEGIGNLYLRACTAGEVCREARSEADGTFRVTALGGVYPVRLWIEDDAGNPVFPDGWYDAASATGFTLNEAYADFVPMNRADVDLGTIGIPRLRYVTGTVYGEALAGPVNEAQVMACRMGPGICYYVSTAEDGSFFIPTLPPDVYRLQVTSQAELIADGWYAKGSPGAYTRFESDATYIDLTGDDATGLDIELPRTWLAGASIGPAAYNGQVCAVKTDSDESYACSGDADVAHLALNLPDGRYRLRLEGAAEFATTWYAPDAPGRVTADEASAAVFEVAEAMLDLGAMTTMTRAQATPPEATIAPAADSVRVARDAAVRVVFSEPVTGAIDGVTITDASAGGAAVAATATWTAATRTLVLTPVALLPAGHVLEVAAGTSIRDTDGNRLARTTSVFTVTTDAVAPKLASRTPAPNATRVSRTANLVAKWGEGVRTAAVKAVLTDTKTGRTVAVRLRWDSARRALTVDPAATLAGKRKYRIAISGVADGAGNRAAAVSWTFTTRA